MLEVLQGHAAFVSTASQQQVSVLASFPLHNFSSFLPHLQAILVLLVLDYSFVTVWENPDGVPLIGRLKSPSEFPVVLISHITCLRSLLHLRQNLHHHYYVR